MEYKFVIGGRNVTVNVTTADTAMGKVDTFGIQVNMRDGGAAVHEYMAPHFDGSKISTEGRAKYYARHFIRHNLATYERNLMFGWHDYTINMRIVHAVIRYPNAYRELLMECVRTGSIKGTRKMILAAGEEWLS